LPIIRPIQTTREIVLDTGSAWPETLSLLADAFGLAVRRRPWFLST